MANSNGWGDGASNNDIGWGQGADNAIGWGAIYANSWAGATDIVGTPAVDPDAQAFITAASITDPTQQSAINTLVTDLKGYGVWTKMKAIYPFIGGTAAQHKWNLKDPRDLDAAFRLVFNGGWTHSSTGALPNGTNGYADTKFNPVSQSSSLNSFFMSIYSRTNSNAGSAYEIASAVDWSTGQNFTGIITRYSSNTRYISVGGNYNTSNAETDSRGYYCGGTNGSATQILYKNGSNVLSGTSIQTGFANLNLSLSGINQAAGTYVGFSNKQLAFAHIGDGLSSTEAANFYTAVQSFQTTLGRSIGTQTVSDADAQAFVTNAGIVDQVEANAVNNLVIGLKADGLWTKMKAVYPFVGGTSTSTSYNLVNTSLYQISWSGGVTWGANGVQFNGVNGYGNTNLTPSTSLNLNSTHLSLYSRTNTNTGVDMGVQRGTTYILNVARSSGQAYTYINSQSGEIYSNSDGTGFYLGNRQASNDSDAWKNGVKQVNGTSTTNPSEFANTPIFIGAFNSLGTASAYSNKQLAFASIGDGLSDTEAANYYTAVQAFQTALNRNV